MYALVDANSFYASCERAFRPDLDGRPIVVLSNNDGCIVARSKEAKTLGIDMQQPYFKIKHLLKQHNVAVFSSNYTLYADMSRRMQDVLRGFGDEMEVYSIDESFLWWGSPAAEGWNSLGHRIRNTIQQWTALTVGVGIAPSKTLAKLANHIAKRTVGATGVHVIDGEDAINAALGSVELDDIWGISGGFRRRLGQLGITTPVQLRDAQPSLIRRHLGVVGERMVYELRGQPCIELEPEPPDKQMICCSRSFGQVSSSFEVLREAVATFACQAAVKLRRQELAAAHVGVFIQTDRHAHVAQYAATWHAPLFSPTADSRTIAEHAAWCLSRIYRPEHRYKKAGVLLMDLCKNEIAQRNLWDVEDVEPSNRLMHAMDTINRHHGRGTIRLASASPITLKACRTWHMRSDLCSPRYTTRWEQLPVARAI